MIDMLKIKEFERFAFSAWSPCAWAPPYLATLTAAREDLLAGVVGQTDSPVLELFALNLSGAELEMRPKIGLEVESKATCLCWSFSRGEAHLGLLIAGDAVGGLALYDPEALVNRSETYATQTNQDRSHIVNDSDVTQMVKCAMKNSVHTGVVKCIDSNRFQTNLFASVADEGEIFIWDMEKMDQPMIPSARTQPLESITTVAWNPRVQHILATASAGNCVIWDLRRSESVVHLTKAMCQFEPHFVAWSPDTATRLCLADPAHPTADIQLWDLRYPKHMLALLGRWPPSRSSDLSTGANNLGNAGNVNALAWSPAPQFVNSRPGLSLHDPDLVAVSITASGALPTVTGGCGSGLEPTSADFLVVWSVTEALKSLETEIASPFPHSVRQPLFIGRLEGGCEEDSVTPNAGGVPATSIVHWIPSHPGLVSVTQPDGWTGIYNLDAGAFGDATAPTRSINVARSTRTRLASHKVAEAFAELEVDLQGGANGHDSDLLKSKSCFTFDNSCTNGIGSQGVDSSIHRLPQPMPRLRVPGRWNKRPCGVNFAFGGRIISFGTSSEVNRRPRSSTSLSVSRQSATVSGETSTSIAESTSGNSITEEKESARTVSIEWVDTIDAYPIPGMKFAVKFLPEEKLHDVVGCMLQWMDQVLTEAPDQLDGICDKLAEVCLPNLINCNTSWKSPWELLKAQFLPKNERVTNLSIFLGFDSSEIQKDIELALNQTTVSTEADFNLPYVKESDRESVIQNLNILRTVLVTGDLNTAIRLCMHPLFSGLSFPGLSILSSAALLLSHQHQTPEQYITLQSNIVNGFKFAGSLSSAEDTGLSTVMALLVGLIQDDWATVISEWPLSDWSTAIAVLVNHIWVSDAPLFRRLCAVLINRLLDPLSEHSLSAEERGSAAWACSVISGDLNGLIRAWYRLCDIENLEKRGETLLPLAIQLLVLVRAVGCTETVSLLVLDSTTSVPDVPTVTEVFSSVALWLIQAWAGRSGKEGFTALRLLRLIVDTTTPELNEIAHRLWCSLPDDQRACAPIKFEPPFYCPFLQPNNYSLVSGCRCGMAQHLRSEHVPTQCGYLSQPVPYQINPISDCVNSSASSLTFHPPASMTGYITQSNESSTCPISPRPTVPLQQGTLPPNYTSKTVGTVHPPMPPMKGDQPWLPPSHPNQAVRPVVPPTSPVETPNVGSLFAKPITDPKTSAFLSNPPQPPPMLPPTSFPTHGFPEQNATPLSSRTCTSRAWNDPPFLAKAYQPPLPPVVSTNEFYDPAQYVPATTPRFPLPAGSLTNDAPNLIANSPTFPQSTNLPCWNNGQITSGVQPPPIPPLISTTFASSTFGDSQLNRNVTPVRAPTAGVVQPPMPPLLNRVIGSAAVPDQNYPSLTNNVVSSTLQRPAVPPLVSTAPHPQFDPSQWPAAQPLAYNSLYTNAASGSVGSALTPTSESVASHIEPECVPSIAPIIPEYEAVQSTLCKLIQQCRNCGGKPFASKMDAVDRRLQSLFAALRGGPGSHLMSDQVLRHLLDCVHAADLGDYGAAVKFSNSLIQSASSFETIHSFAPSLKILMQSAKQLFPNQKPG